MSRTWKNRNGKNKKRPKSTNDEDGKYVPRKRTDRFKKKQDNYWD